MRREVDFNDPVKKAYLEKLKEGLMRNSNYTDFDVDRLPVRIDSAIHQENFKWLYNTICHMDRTERNEIVARVRREYEAIDHEKSQLTTSSKRVLILSGIQIVLSIGLLIFVPFLNSVCLLPYIAMIPNLLFFMLIIFFTVKTILKTLQVSRIVDR